MKQSEGRGSFEVDAPMDPRAGRSDRRERLWGLIGGVVGAGAGIGSFLIAWLVQGEALSDLVGSPYPPLLSRTTFMPVDLFFLTLVIVGAVFLGAAVVIARSGRYPRTDGFGATLVGAVLTVLGGVILFVRLWAVLHA